jgi:sulfur relay (sulfurtransferase) DsrF/TusC family protein
MAETTLVIFEKPIYLCMEPVDPHLFATAFGVVETPVQVNVLLRDSAVTYAVERQDMKGAKVLGVDVQEFDTNPARVVRFMLEHGGRVYVVREDAEARGIAPTDLVPGVELISREETVGLIETHDAVMVW